MTERPVPLLNLPNALTVARLILVPVFLLCLFNHGGTSLAWRWIAASVFAVAAITDHLDGWIARNRGLVTDFGKIADPIADKALTGSALIALSMLGNLTWWITAIIMVREIGITMLRFAVIRHRVIAASAGGKLKTLVQISAIGLYLMPLPSAVDWLRIGLMYLAVALTVGTGVHYLINVRAVLRKATPTS